VKNKIFHSLPSLGDAEVKACAKVLKSNYIASGPENKKLAKSLCERYQRKYAILVSSGASALFLTLKILKKKNKYVILPSYVCSALLNAVNQAGLKPIIADTPVDGIFMNNSTNALAKKVNLKNSIILYPQMFGVIKKLNFPKNIPLIEDCAMSLGSNALSQGDVSIMSMYATKMMTSGQGGAILTDKIEIYEELSDILSYDNRDIYKQRYNYALSDLNAAIANVQLQKLDGFIKKRLSLCEYYDDLITKNIPEALAFKGGFLKKYTKDAPFRYWIKIKNVTETIQHLSYESIEVKKPVYKPLHEYLNLDSTLYPYATKSHNKILSLPLYPDLKRTQVKKVVEQLKRVIVT
jgi:dTDP-4-amino-4,6-dideoxygalactose transaminase